MPLDAFMQEEQPEESYCQFWEDKVIELVSKVSYLF